MAWPLSRVLPWIRRAEFIWNNWNLFRAEEDSVFLDYEAACGALQTRLGGKDSFFDNS
jgi:hypothetical protein